MIKLHKAAAINKMQGLIAECEICIKNVAIKGINPPNITHAILLAIATPLKRMFAGKNYIHMPE